MRKGKTYVERKAEVEREREIKTEREMKRGRGENIALNTDRRAGDRIHPRYIIRGRYKKVTMRKYETDVKMIATRTERERGRERERGGGKRGRDRQTTRQR